MTLTLSKDTIQWLLESQQKLDDNIKQVKGITDEKWIKDLSDNHFIALKVEISEFINNCHDHWKYWKSKPVNMEEILDEAIDVIHFIMLVSNKVGEDITAVHETLTNHCEVLESEEGEEHATPMMLLKFMLNTEDILMILAAMLRILDGYQFTEQDIIDQYKVKNAENFRRLETGY